MLVLKIKINTACENLNNKMTNIEERIANLPEEFLTKLARKARYTREEVGTRRAGKHYRVLYMAWEESERGGGGERHDGCSLHLTAEDSEAFIKEYWAGMPDAVPDEYSRKSY